MECVGISSQLGEQVPSQAPHPPEGVCECAMPVSVPSVFPNLYIAPSQFWVDDVQMRFLRSFVFEHMALLLTVPQGLTWLKVQV